VRSGQGEDWGQGLVDRHREALLHFLLRQRHHLRHALSLTGTVHIRLGRLHSQAHADLTIGWHRERARGLSVATGRKHMYSDRTAKHTTDLVQTNALQAANNCKRQFHLTRALAIPPSWAAVGSSFPMISLVLEK
jgi:hypothetical protein